MGVTRTYTWFTLFFNFYSFLLNTVCLSMHGTSPRNNSLCACVWHAANKHPCSLVQAVAGVRLYIPTYIVVRVQWSWVGHDLHSRTSLMWNQSVLFLYQGKEIPVNRKIETASVKHWLPCPWEPCLFPTDNCVKNPMKRHSAIANGGNCENQTISNSALDNVSRMIYLANWFWTINYFLMKFVFLCSSSLFYLNSKKAELGEWGIGRESAIIILN